MNVYIKVKGIEQACYVPNVKKIIVTDFQSGQTEEITNFEKFIINTYAYYVFVGDGMLHVRGEIIEFLQFVKS
uniref:hypothetical protein n=1 Tax=uncultured Allisonella sp. TaxID=339338 RepID=UPI00280596B8|nr:hypothetical protein [uncultured Allisonella sp.]